MTLPAPMKQNPIFTTCARAGHNGKNLGFQIILDDGQAVEIQMTVECFANVLANGWKAVAALPTESSRSVALPLTGELSFASVAMQPALILRSGAVALSLGLDELSSKALRDDIERYLAEFRTGRTH